MLFVRPNLIVIMDDLEAPAPSRFEYLLHAPAAFQVAGQEDVAVRVGEAGVSISLLAPAGLHITQTDKFDTPPQEHIQLDEHHLTAATAEQATRQQFVALLRPHRQDETVATGAEVERTEAGYAVRARYEDGSVVVVWRTGPGTLEGWGLTSDAPVAAVILDSDGRPLRTFASGGGTVRWNGQTPPSRGQKP
jgi:hypothetical protein